MRKMILYHLLGWSFYISYETFFMPVFLGIQPAYRSVSAYALSYAISIGLFYFHAGYTLPKIQGRQPHAFGLFAALLIIELVSYLFLMDRLNWLFGLNPLFKDGYSLDQLRPVLKKLCRGLYFLVFSTAYWLISRAFRIQRQVLNMEKQQLIDLAEKNKLEKNLAETENAYLRAQINPHLLFNTLNFIYSNVQDQSEPASETVLLLSDLMNYSLSEPEGDGMTPLSRELGQIRNLIRINQLRFDNGLHLDIETDDDLPDFRIIPLLIVGFVENVFKHGDLTDPEHPATIRLTLQNDLLQFTTVNKKKKRSYTGSHGIGLANARNRLEKAYGQACRLETRNEETLFYVHLNINLNAVL